MSANLCDELGALALASDAGAEVARVNLLRREFRALLKIDTVLYDMIEAEELAGVDIGSAHLEAARVLLGLALKAVVGALPVAGGVPA